MSASNRRRALGALIKRFRKKRQMNVADLASEIGVSRSLVGQWETGDRSPRHYAEALGRLFDVSPETFSAEDPEEVELFRYFHRMSPEAKAALLRVVRKMTDATACPMEQTR